MVCQVSVASNGLNTIQWGLFSDFISLSDGFLVHGDLTKVLDLVLQTTGTWMRVGNFGISYFMSSVEKCILSSLSNQDFDCVHKLYKFGRLISFLLKCKATFEEVKKWLVGHNVVSNSHVCLVEGCFFAVDMCVNENALFCYFVEYLRHCSATLNGTFIHTNHSFHHCPKFPPKGSSRSQIASLKHFLKWPWLCHNALVREKWSIVINWWQNFHSFSSFMPLSGWIVVSLCSTLFHL